MAYVGVIILAKICVMFSLVIMERARYITPPWLFPRRSLYPLHRYPPSTEWNNMVSDVQDPVTWTSVWPNRKMKPWVKLMESLGSLGEQRAMDW